MPYNSNKRFHYEFDLSRSKGNVRAKLSYPSGFNGQERDDELAGVGNFNTALYWEYDTRLGRRWNVDPVPVTPISPYNCFSGNPILYSDNLGDKIKNGYEESKKSAENNVENRKDDLVKANGKYNKFVANFKLRQAERKLDRVTDLYNQTQDLMKNFAENNSVDFSELDNLKDANDVTVDVYLRVENNLYSNRFNNAFDAEAQKKDLDGLTQVSPQSPIPSVKSDKTGIYLPVKSILYGNNTAVIIIDANVMNKLRAVSHEAGHAIYNVKNMLQYVQWLQDHPNTPPGGHGPNNPSGEEAKKREEPFNKK